MKIFVVENCLHNILQKQLWQQMQAENFKNLGLFYFFKIMSILFCGSDPEIDQKKWNKNSRPEDKDNPPQRFFSSSEIPQRLTTKVQ